MAANTGTHYQIRHAQGIRDRHVFKFNTNMRLEIHKLLATPTVSENFLLNNPTLMQAKVPYQYWSEWPI